MRVVLDTNVLFAAFRLEVGFCADLFRYCILQHEIFISDHILTELRRHLTGKGKLETAKVAEVIEAIRTTVNVVTPSLVANDACRDIDDLPVLGTALAAKAQVLVTGDKDLLSLQKFESTVILSPRAFYDLYLSSGQKS